MYDRTNFYNIAKSLIITQKSFIDEPTYELECLNTLKIIISTALITDEVNNTLRTNYELATILLENPLSLDDYKEFLKVNGVSTKLASVDFIQTGIDRFLIHTLLIDNNVPFTTIDPNLLQTNQLIRYFKTSNYFTIP